MSTPETPEDVLARLNRITGKIDEDPDVPQWVTKPKRRSVARRLLVLVAFAALAVAAGLFAYETSKNVDTGKAGTTAQTTTARKHSSK